MESVLQGLQGFLGASFRPDMLGAVYWLVAYGLAALLLFTIFGFFYVLFFLALPVAGWVRGAGSAAATGEVTHEALVAQSNPSLSYHSSVLRSPSSNPISGT